MIKWEKTTSDDLLIISQIVNRAQELYAEADINIDRMTFLMDIEAVHIITPLRLSDLLNADDSNFLHDISGINRHIDRQTGKLLNCFVPRYSA